MRIRKLEMQGFKSFPERTIFHFGNGISGVVGPNGCGKSNVVDAVKWCLGEQSARSLRGNAMQDVIFAGAEGRSPLGLAEVSLTFIAGDEPFPGEMARCEEVQVTRRLFRDGASEYLINQQRVRRRDITDLFLDSGAANRLYSFIEQGRIGTIVKARPEERRTLIEEAAGISRYKARRTESEAKLRETQKNLDRMADLVEELGTRVRGLHRQVTKAVKYRRLRSRTRQAELFVGLVRYSALSADRRVLAEKMRDADVQRVAADRHVQRCVSEMKKVREALGVLEEGVGRTRDAIGGLEADRRETESARQYQDREIITIEQRLVVVAQQVEEARAVQEQAEARRQTIEEERSTVDTTLESMSGELTDLNTQTQSSDQGLREVQEAIDGAKSALVERAKRMGRLEGERQTVETRLSDLVDRETRMQVQAQAQGADLQGLQADIEKADATLQGVMQGCQLAQTQVSAAEALVDEMTEKVQQDGKALQQSEGEWKESHRTTTRISARLESIEALLRSHEGIDDATVAILDLQGSQGTLAENIDVPKALEGKLAAILGSVLDAVLVDNMDAAIQIAKSSKGALRLLCVDAVERSLADEWRELDGTPIGLRAVAQVMSCLTVAPTLKEGMEGLYSSDASGHKGWSVVHGAEGAAARISPWGEVVLGVPAGSGAVVLARRRQAKQLRQECDVAQQSEQNARDLLAKAEQRLQVSKEQNSEKSTALVLARAQMRDAEKAKREATHEHSVLLKERVRQQRLSEDITTEMNAVHTARSALRLRQEQVEKEAKDSSVMSEELERKIGQLQERLEVAKQVRDKIWNERTTKEQLVVGLKERVNGLNRSIGEIVTTIERTTVQVQNGNTEIGNGHARIEELRKDDVRLAEKLQTLGETQASLRERLETERLQVLKERERVTERETVVEQAREAHKEAEKAKSDLEHALVETRAEIGRVREQVSDKHDVSVAGMLDRVERVGHYTVEVDPTARGKGIIGVAPPKGRDAELIQELRITRSMLESESEVEKWVAELTTLRAETERLGEVNLVAMLEYQEVAERHEALGAQEADLMESIASIRKTIAALNKTCRERFRETYDLVNQYFSEGYPRLVGGGSACIQLTDEEDLLEAGVEIFVQPPGKRLQTLSLLSGGETAMVAIAFIFALFRVKPSPFCLLDEVDAPLDEGNGIRFNSMLREMSELAQFIVITHNKKTMECADTLYGVTMPIPGVSRLVTVRLD